ncbi:MAG: hypothetical protein GTO22_08735, partial [Gemmatimonadales bacterium]|nr:hypothetical protein [Gemmatimonadales bacterium]
VTYEEVVEEGSTSIVVTDELPGPEPAGLTFVEDFTYEIRTTGEISGAVTAAVDYSDTSYPPVLGERLSVLLWNGADWVDITTAIDTAAHTITGQFMPGAEREWYVALALDPPPVPDVKVMFEGCTDGQPVGPSLFVADADLSNPVRVTNSPLGTTALPECVCGCGEVAGTWSPGGTRVVSVRAESSALSMLDLETLVQTPGQEPQLLTDQFGDPIEAGMPAWSPSGDQIVYPSCTVDRGVMMMIEAISAVNPDGTGAHALYTFPDPVPRHFRYPDWS